jgi:hypothetical protein
MSLKQYAQILPDLTVVKALKNYNKAQAVP